jgi:ankyrin repeat protein
MLIDTPFDNGSTPLHVAVYRNPCQNYVAEELLKGGADPNLRDKSEQTPLDICNRALWNPSDNARTSETLIRFGANVNDSHANGSTPAHFHAATNSVASLRALINAGARLEAKMTDGGTPLYIAVVNGSYDAVKLLLDLGANTEDLSNTEPSNYNALGWAVAHGKTPEESEYSRIIVEKRHCTLLRSISVQT